MMFPVPEVRVELTWITPAGFESAAYAIPPLRLGDQGGTRTLKRRILSPAALPICLPSRTPGGIRTHTEQNLNLSPPANWATGACYSVVQYRHQESNLASVTARGLQPQVAPRPTGLAESKGADPSE